MKVQDLNIYYPTVAEWRGMDESQAFKFFHYACNGVQYAVNYVPSRCVYAVCVLNDERFRDIFPETFRSDRWYRVTEFDDLNSAIQSFNTLVFQYLYDVGGFRNV